MDGWVGRVRILARRLRLLHLYGNLIYGNALPNIKISVQRREHFGELGSVGHERENFGELGSVGHERENLGGLGSVGHEREFWGTRLRRP